MKFNIRWEHNGEHGEGEMVFKTIEVPEVIDWQEETSGLAIDVRAQRELIADLIADQAELKEEVRKLKFKKFDKFMESIDGKKKKPKK